MGECHYLYGNVHVSKEMDVVSNLLNLSGIGRDRLCVRWVSAAEGQRFQEKILVMQNKLKTIGQEEIKRGMKVFGQREKDREERQQQRTGFEASAAPERKTKVPVESGRSG